MLIDIIEYTARILLNMLFVLVAAVFATFVTSFFRDSVVTFKTLYLVIVFVSGTLNPILGLVGGGASSLLAHLKGDFAQRELATLFTLVLFVLGSWVGVIPSIDEVPNIDEIPDGISSMFGTILGEGP